jgi:3-oxoacyl-[acyl-carrier-protein] synthase II
MHPALKDATKNGFKKIDFRILNKSTMDKVNPFFLLESIANNLFSFLSAAFQFMGPNTSLGSLSPCGAHALELACRRIGNGQADAALAVGCGCWVSEIPMYEMQGLGILSKCRQGEASFRPLDRARDGFIPGEGGAAILLEDAEAAQARGARILAEIKGTGNCTEFPSGKGLSVPEQVSKSSICAALEEGGMDPGDVGFICPHASGTRKGDRSELNSISKVLGDQRSRIPVCALKPYTGHMGAASDICEVVLGIKAINDGIVPGTPNFSRPEAAFEDMAISASSRPAVGKSFLSISYGIIGQSSCILVEGCAR